jgi:hypothetical protein
MHKGMFSEGAFRFGGAGVKVLNRIERLPKSDLITPASVPAGLEAIATRDLDGGSSLFIKTDAY